MKCGRRYAQEDGPAPRTPSFVMLRYVFRYVYIALGFQVPGVA